MIHFTSVTFFDPERKKKTVLILWGSYFISSIFLYMNLSVFKLHTLKYWSCRSLVQKHFVENSASHNRNQWTVNTMKMKFCVQFFVKCSIQKLEKIDTTQWDIGSTIVEKFRVNLGILHNLKSFLIITYFREFTWFWYLIT